MIFFFFSSRRRHTRLQGDWSSDVCSSDLAGVPPLRGSPPHSAGRSDGGASAAPCDPGSACIESFSVTQAKLYVVTGGAGFIGSNLGDALVRRDDRVRVLDDLSTGRRANLA